jgi:hypothetical protein
VAVEKKMNLHVLFKVFSFRLAAQGGMKKRDEREYDEQLPEGTRKARLEEEAATLLSLPSDIRKMVMIKLHPIDMYALYSGVDNYAFKKWCDRHFWNWALPVLLPDYEPPAYMVHPRWRFFSYTLASLFFNRTYPLRNAYFVNPRVPANVDDGISIHIGSNGTSFSFQKTHVDIGRFLFDTHVANSGDLPNIRTALGSPDATVTVLPTTRVIIAACYYRFFGLGLKYSVNASTDHEFAIGCHLCGSTAVTGYSAEDPSKLLCGRECTEN